MGGGGIAGEVSALWEEVYVQRLFLLILLFFNVIQNGKLAPPDKPNRQD